METAEEIQYAIDEILANIDDDRVIEILVLGQMSEKIRMFERLRDLIAQKQSENDDIAADVLGWAYERLAE